MKFFPLVIANLMRHKLRTTLTIMSVALALFLFASLRTVVTQLEISSRLGAANRMIVQNATAFVFPLPQSYAGRLAAVPHVTGVTWANWFGGKYGDGKKFIAPFAVDPASYLDMYKNDFIVPPDQKEAFLRERTAVIVGQGLLKAFGWKIGDNITFQGTIFPGDWTFTIRGTYSLTVPAYGDEQFLFHYDYLYERVKDSVSPGWFILRIDDPAQSGVVAKTIDDQFRNSPAPTKTGTEQSFSAGFMTMFSNIQLLMGTIGMAVVFAILLIAANAMLMNQRERTSEVAVLKTVGFSDRTIFMLVIVEAAFIALTGAIIGIGLAIIIPRATNFNAFGFLPDFHVTNGTIMVGAGIALLLSVISGFAPAYQAARMPVVQALRKVE
ncbi:MAG: FtsX-like permease family protein [Gemmatimonadaceae bacterium]|nr:FtsX-like permease family protein [Gemmatimonadaceae bacterium]